MVEQFCLSFTYVVSLCDILVMSDLWAPLGPVVEEETLSVSLFHSIPHMTEVGKGNRGLSQWLI